MEGSIFLSLKDQLAGAFFVVFAIKCFVCIENIRSSFGCRFSYNKDMMQFGGKYQLEDRIGGGSFGEIYLVRNIKTDEECAAKEEVIKIPTRSRRSLGGGSLKDTENSIQQNDGMANNLLCRY